MDLRPAAPTVAGLGLTMLGVGNVWRGGGATVIGACLIMAGVVVTGVVVRRQRRRLSADEAATMPLRRHLMMLAAPLALGTVIYTALLVLFDRS